MSSLETTIKEQIQYHTNEIQRLQEQLKSLGSLNYIPAVSNPTTGRMFADCVITQPIGITPIDFIKGRVRVSAEELYSVYNLDTRSKRTILSNTLCKNNTGIIKKKSNGKLYFIYQL